MPKKSKLVPYSLKLDEELWNQINKNRMSLVGVLYPQGISKKGLYSKMPCLLTTTTLKPQ